MANTVAVNKRTVVHRGSKGFAIGFPDICFTPPTRLPLPYCAIALSRDAHGTCSSVYCDGQRVMKDSSFCAPTHGDEAGTQGGTRSQVSGGPAYFLEGSMDVKFEGEQVPRHLDQMGLNAAAFHAGLNVEAPIVQTDKDATLRETLCIAFCHCNEKFFKMRCFQPLFADCLGSKLFDPYEPGVWLEVPYDMSKTPPEMQQSAIPSKHQTDGKKPLNIPMPQWISFFKKKEQILIPDVVVADNPHKPPTVGNIKQIYEIKFDGDSEGDDRQKQVIRQREIFRKVEVLDRITCQCAERESSEDEEYRRKQKEAEDANLRDVEVKDDFLPNPGLYHDAAEFVMEVKLLYDITHNPAQAASDEEDAEKADKIYRDLTDRDLLDDLDKAQRRIVGDPAPPVDPADLQEIEEELDFEHKLEQKQRYVGR